MKRRIAALGLAFSGTLAGCFQFDMGLGPDLFGTGMGGCYFCIPFGIIHDGVYSTILKGDTIRVRVLSTDGHDKATFSVSGNALMLVTGSTLSQKTSKPANEAMVVGIAVGRDTVRAQASDTSLTGALALRVADSASITQVVLVAELNPTIKVSLARPLEVVLREGDENIAGRPTSAFTSDSTVVRIEPAQWDEKYLFLRGMAVGSADVTVRFLERTHTVRFQVTP